MSINKSALDRHITGNWGEDSVPDLPPICDDCEVEDCPKDCEKLAKFYQEEVEDHRRMEEALGLYEHDENEEDTK